MADLNLRVLVDVIGANRLSGLGGQLQSTGRTLTRNVTLPLLGAAAGFVTLAADAEKSEAKLKSVFDSMGASSWTTVEALEAQAQALADATTFDDEGIRDAQSKMLTFGDVTGEAFDRAIEASADLSTVFEQDLQTSAVMVGKALNDPIRGLTSLSRIGVQFTDEQRETITTLVEMGDTAAAQGIILEELERQVGGAARALGQTDTGQAQQALEELGEAGEQLGAVILPVLADVATGVTGLATTFQTLPPPVQQAIIILGGIAIVAGPVMLAVNGLAGAFNLLKLAILHIPTLLGFVDLALAKTGAAFRLLTAIMLTNPFVALAAAVIAIVLLIASQWDKVVLSFQNLWRDIQNVVGMISRFLGQAWENITGAAEAAWNGLVGIIKGAINAVIGAVNSFIGALNGIQIHIPGFDTPFGKVAGFDWWGLGLPTIPYLAEGGIITRQTLAVLGESGPEAVIPLNRAGELGGDTYNFYIQGTVEDEEELVSLFTRTQRLNKAFSGG